MSIPNLDNVIDYGQYGSGQYGSGSTQRAAEAWQQAHPLKPADSISISLEFLRGVQVAADWTYDAYGNPEWDDIFDAVVAAEIVRLHEEATK